MASTEAIIFFLILTLSVCYSSAENIGDPVPKPWPPQFHANLLKQKSGIKQIVQLYYDWPHGRNMNMIQFQLGDLIYDVEWNNGTSFFFTTETCSSAQLDVGMVPPNWMDGAKYVGRRRVDGFLCDVWEKAEVLLYYEDVVTRRPVHWIFSTGRETHVMTFEVGVVLEDEKWQAPVYCFNGDRSPELKVTQDPTSYAASHLLG